MPRWGVVILLSIWPQVAASQELPDTLDRIRNSLVYLNATAETETGIPVESHGTGFFINASGNILTTYHLITALEDAGAGSPIRKDTIAFEARLGSKSDPAIPVEVVDARPLRDLLLLDVEEAKSGPAVCVNLQFSVQRLSGSVFTAGFPKALPFVADDGVIVSADAPSGTWVTDAVINEGQSGSPIFTADGRVVGIAKGQMKDRDTGVPVPGLYVVIPIAEVVKVVPAPQLTTNCAAESAPVQPQVSSHPTLTVSNAKFSEPGAEASADLVSVTVVATNHTESTLVINEQIECLGTDLEAEESTSPLISLFQSAEPLVLRGNETDFIHFRYDSTSPIVFETSMQARRFWTVDGKLLPKHACRFSYVDESGQLALSAMPRQELLTSLFGP